MQPPRSPETERSPETANAAESDETDDAVVTVPSTEDESADTAASAEQSATVDALAQQLGEAIAALPEYERYESARAAVANDETAQERIAEFERLREELQLARQTGQATEEAVARVRDAQRELHSLPVMEEYLAAENALTARLESVNRTISEPLSVDFGGEAGGCCRE